METKKCKYCGTVLEESSKFTLCEDCMKKWDEYILPIILKSSDDLLEQRRIGKKFCRRLEFWKVVDINKYNILVEEKKRKNRENAKKRYLMASDEKKSKIREHKRRYSRIYSRIYYRLNKEKLLEKAKIYYLKKKEAKNGRKEIV